MYRESVTLKTVKAVNLWLNFLYRKNWFLTPELLRLLCNAIIQRHFYSTWYHNLTQELN